MEASTTSRTPSKRMNNTLLIPHSVAKGSLLLSPISAAHNKENTTPQRARISSSSKHGNHDNLMSPSPLKSALKKHYPVMTPFNMRPSIKRSISFASPLQQASPNTSCRQAVQDEEDDTTMTSATASILDGLMVDEDEQLLVNDRPSSIQAHNNAEPQYAQASPVILEQEQHRHDSMSLLDADNSLVEEHLPGLDEPVGQARVLAVPEAPAAQEEADLAVQESRTPLKELQDTIILSDRAPICTDEHDQTAMVPPSSSSSSSSKQDQTTTTSSDIEAIGRNSSEELELEDLTTQAAQIPLPASPIKPQRSEQEETNRPVRPLPRRRSIIATPAKSVLSMPLFTLQEQDTPLLLRTANAARIPLPASAAPTSRIYNAENLAGVSSMADYVETYTTGGDEVRNASPVNSSSSEKMGMEMEMESSMAVLGDDYAENMDQTDKEEVLQDQASSSDIVPERIFAPLPRRRGSLSPKKPSTSTHTTTGTPMKLQSSGSTTTATPLSKRTEQAAEIPLPASAAPPSRIILANSPKKKQRMVMLAAEENDENGPAEEQEQEQTRRQQVGTPLLSRTALAAAVPLPMSAIPSCRTFNTLPASPITMSNTAVAAAPAVSDEDDEEVNIEEATLAHLHLPFAEQDKIDSPVKAIHSRLNDMPFSRVRNVPSPVKRSAQESGEGNRPEIEMESDMMYHDGSEVHDMKGDGAVDEQGPAISMMGETVEEAVQMAELEEGQAETENDANKQTSSSTTTPVEDIDFATPNPAVQEAMSNNMQESQQSAELTPARVATPCSVTSRSQASIGEYAPGLKTRKLATVSSSTSTILDKSKSFATLSTSESSSSLSSRSASSASISQQSGVDTPEQDEEESAMLSMDVVVNDTPAAYTPKQRGLKRKASASSIVDSEESLKTEDNQGASTTATTTRRITRQRSLTMLQRQQQSVAAEAETPAPVSNAPSMAIKLPSSAMQEDKQDVDMQSAQIEAKEEAGQVQAHVVATAKPAPRTRRQSSRVASTSALPQPKSRIAKRTPTPSASTAATISTSTAATTKSTGTVTKARAIPTRKGRNAKLVESDSPQEQEDDSEADSDSGPVVVSASSSASTRRLKTEQTLEEDAEPVPAAPPAALAKRPQRSARPARLLASATASAKPLPSPSRVASPVKATLRPSRATASSTKAPSSSDQSGKMAPRSPGRVLLSPAKASTSTISSSQLMRSPSRVLPYQIPRSPRLGTGASSVDWSSAPAQSHAGSAASMPSTLSPGRYRRAASKIFGSSDGSSSSASLSAASNGAASSAPAHPGSQNTLSPFKGIAQRLPIPGSPSLLNLSVAPELLVLGPRSPSPTRVEHDTDMLTASIASAGTSASSSGLLQASTSSAPEVRRISAPTHISPRPVSTASGLLSPRRALSAQPQGSIPRNELPSPRRVVPQAMRSGSTPVMPSTSAPARSIFPMTSATQAPSRSLIAPVTRQVTPSSASTAAMPGIEPVASSSARASLAGDAPRRSQRSARPQRMVLLPAAATSEQVTPIAGPSKPAAPAKSKSVATVTATQVSTITNQNTSVNRKPYNHHEVTVIYKDEDRPPSPTSKIRKVCEEVSASKEAKTSRGALAKATRERQQTSQPSASDKAPHFMAPGDEGLYESPIKGQRTRKLSVDEGSDERPAKTVKWDRDLLKPGSKVSSPPGNGRTAAVKPPRRTVCKNKRLDLDGFGNVPECKMSLSPVIPREKVGISKIIYRDDDPEDDDD